MTRKELPPLFLIIKRGVAWELESRTVVREFWLSHVIGFFANLMQNKKLKLAVAVSLKLRFGKVIEECREQKAEKRNTSLSS